MHHDACGVGFVARLAGESGHDIVRHGLTALVRLAHRGAPASLGFVDGCGLLTAIPWPVVQTSLRGVTPPGRTRALGMLFVHPSDVDKATALVERELQSLGVAWAWRTVPTDRVAVLKAQRASTPRVLQVVLGMADARSTADERLFRARLRVESAARAAGVRLDVVSLSTRTVVYKALTTPEALPVFYPDLTDPASRPASSCSTSDSARTRRPTGRWRSRSALLAHNGEINTIAGNRAWMRARLLDATSLPGFDGSPVGNDGSDSRTLDEAVELLRHRGYSVAHALSRLMPPAWERDRDLAPDVRAFYEFQSLHERAVGRAIGARVRRRAFRRCGARSQRIPSRRASCGPRRPDRGGVGSRHPRRLRARNRRSRPAGPWRHADGGSRAWRRDAHERDPPSPRLPPPYRHLVEKTFEHCPMRSTWPELSNAEPPRPPRIVQLGETLRISCSGSSLMGCTREEIESCSSR